MRRGAVYGKVEDDEMTCTQWRERAQEWLEANDYESGELPDELSAHMEECGACSAQFRALMRLFGGEGGGDLAPPRLEERIMERVRREAASGRPPDEPGRERRFTATTAWIPKAAAALLLIALTAVVTLYLNGTGGEPSSQELVTVRLELRAPNAEVVSVVGDWNGWDPEANPLSDSDNDGIWVATIEVQPGQDYQYQFLIDQEQWMPDPNAPIRVKDGFGGQNSVLNL